MLKRLLTRHLERSGRRIVKWPLRRTTTVDSHIAELLAVHPVNVLLDVGAHRGETGVRFRALGFTGRIVSFEPIHDNLAALNDRAAGDRDWQVLPYALGDVGGTAVMRQAAGTVLSSLHDPSAYGAQYFATAMRATGEQAVAVRRLDDVVDECLGGIDIPSIYLKIDTQGHDISVLQGASRVIPKVACLQMETAVRPLYQDAPTFQQTFEYAISQGFLLTAFFTGSRDRTLAANEMDAFFVREQT